jgi:hypothetical protein
LSATYNLDPGFADEYSWIGRPAAVDGPRMNTFPTTAICDGPEP